MMHRPFAYYLLCLLLIACGMKPIAVFAQDIQVEAKTDRARILIGDQLDFSVSARYNPQTHRVQLPVPSDTFNHFEVISKGGADTLRQESFQRITQHYRITSFDSGQWEIPAMDFTIQPLQGDTPFVMQSNSLAVDVQTVAVDTSKPFKPIMGIRPAALPNSLLIKNILIGLAILLSLGLLIYYLVKRFRRKKSKVTDTPMAVLLPHEKALQHLLETEQKAAWMSGEEKLYYTDMTHILRTYLEEQFGIDCFEKTTAEIVQQVKRQRILNPFRQTLRDLLQLADLVKFAKAKPTEDDHRLAMEQARTFVQQSYQKIQVQQSTENKTTPT